MIRIEQIGRKTEASDKKFRIFSLLVFSYLTSDTQLVGRQMYQKPWKKIFIIYNPLPFPFYIVVYKNIINKYIHFIFFSSLKNASCWMYAAQRCVVEVLSRVDETNHSINKTILSSHGNQVYYSYTGPHFEIVRVLKKQVRKSWFQRNAN